MLTVIGTKATRTRRVLWMLEELGLDYTNRPEPPRSEAVTKLNASGKVPVLLDGDAVITDSTAILHYLTDRAGKFTFPAGSAERGRQDALTFRILDEIDGTLWVAARHSFILPEDMRIPEIKESLKWEFARAASRLAADLGEGPYLMGETMTVPDIILAHCLTWAGRAGFPVDEPALAAFLDRMLARPAAQKVYAD